MGMSTKLVALCIALGSACDLSSAAVTYQSQDRRVTAQGGLVTPSSLSAPGFGPFSASVSGFSNLSPSPYSNASQDSELGPLAMRSNMTARGVDGIQTSYGEGISLFDVSFQVSQTTNYELFSEYMIGSINLPNSGQSFSSFELSLFRVGVGTPLFQRTGSISNPVQPTISGQVAQFGVLDPGDYQLRARLTVGYFLSGTQGGGEQGTMSVRLFVPAPPMAAILIASVPMFGRRRPR